ncbi:MAG: four helix bundle protein [Treponema sp.]|jgi:four helix bundle protein|nr:four helix bundle protein [Treponema sp.]
MDQSIKQKSREFAAKVAQLYKHLSSHKKETILSGELLRTGAGVGANLARSECAMGKNDQLAKVYTALQECVEAKYWLEVLNDNEYLTEFEFNDLLSVCDGMGKDLIGLVKTLRAAIAR